ncbi:MAG: PD40 domain-containing protein, partial [Chloroflexi bacterium]|nr:PD40 domain-containing protein [Chloroflexota bacterium]
GGPAEPSPPPAPVRVAPRASAAITRSLQAVDFPAGWTVRPGPWSPDGERLVAYAAETGAAGRLWIVDAESGRPIWDSGDVEVDPAREQAAAWMADGSLAIARRDGMFVDRQGAILDQPAGVDGQPRELFPDPLGQRLLVIGPDGAWIVQRGAAARFLAGWPPAGQAGWSWSRDGLRLALGRPDGHYAVIDALTGEAKRVAEGIERPDVEGMPKPRWLSDGRLLLTAAREIRYQDAARYDHRLVDPESADASSLVETLGIPQNPARPQAIDGAVSPDGRYLLYPEFAGPAPEAGAPAPQRATWLLDLEAGRLRSMPPLGSVSWSPTSDRFAIASASGIDLFDPEMGPVLELPMPPTRTRDLIWSPDGRWLLARDADAGLWLMATDGSAGPDRLAEGVDWRPAPTWSPDGDRIALSSATSDALDATPIGAAPRLVLMRIGKEALP